MKLKKILTYALLLSGFAVCGCESLDDTNIDPTRMTSANAGSFLLPIEYNMGCYTWNRYRSYTFQLMQCLVTTNSTGGVGWFKISDSAGDGAWSNYYKWIANAKAMYQAAVEADDANYQAIAMTLSSWMFETLTESYGDIPMTEACQGDNSLFYPKFDSQKEVYSSVIAALDSANTLYAPSKGLQFNTDGDLMYCSTGSDTEGLKRWRKFTNSLRMRALLRVLDVDGLDAAAKLKEMVDNPNRYPVFDSNDDCAMVSVSGIAPYEAPLVRASDLSSYMQYSCFFIDKLNEWSDPRLPVFANKASNYDEDGKVVSSYVGIESGYLYPSATVGSAPNATALATAPQKLALMTYAEVLFIKAELAQRGIIDADAKELYEKAVTAAIEQWGVEITPNYFDNPAACYDGTLKRIMEQKFYALFFIDHQQWFEYNRTGFPDVPTGPGVDSNDHMPFRFKYPSVTQRINNAHYREAVESMGGDNLDTRLIWQKRK